LALPAAAVSRVLVTGTDLTALREISAWAPVRAEAAQPEVGLDAADPFPARTDDALPVLPLAVAVVLLATAVAGVAATLARRSRRPSYTTPRDSPTTDVVDARAATGDVEPLRAEHSSVSSGSRRGLAEIVAVVLGLTSIILYAGLKLAPGLIEPGDEAAGVFVSYLLFGPPLLLTCPGTFVALVVAVLQRRGSLRASTWLLALPAVLLSVQFAVSSVGAGPPPELGPIPVEPQPGFVPPSFPAVPTPTFPPLELPPIPVEPQPGFVPPSFPAVPTPTFPPLELRPIPVEPQPGFVPPSFPAVPTFPSR